MAKPSKPMAKNSNSKFTTRNNKQDIFSRLAKSPKLLNKPTLKASELEENNPKV